MGGFSKPEFWFWMGIVFGVAAVWAGLLGVPALAVSAAVTGFGALITAYVRARNPAER